MTEGPEEHDVDFTGDEAEERCIICVPCRQYRQLGRDGHPTCEHTISEAKDISDLDALDWAYVRLHAYRQELEREEPRGSEALLQSNLISLVSDLVWADEEVPDPDEMGDVLDRRLSA